MFERLVGGVDRTRASRYCSRAAGCNSNPDVMIPLGLFDSIGYSGYEPGGTNDRNLGEYLSTFGEGWFSGGDDSLVAPGKVYLELGAGQAVGLMQLALKHGNTTFIGIDTLYEQKRIIYPKSPGLQLTRSNWEDLEGIPDGCVDSLVSLQSLGVWGIAEIGDRPKTRETLEIIGTTLNRVTKKGGTLLFDTILGKDHGFGEVLKDLGWKYQFESGKAVATKI